MQKLLVININWKQTKIWWVLPTMSLQTAGNSTKCQEKCKTTNQGKCVDRLQSDHYISSSLNCWLIGISQISSFIFLVLTKPLSSDNLKPPLLVFSGIYPRPFYICSPIIWDLRIENWWICLWLHDYVIWRNRKDDEEKELY